MLFKFYSRFEENKDLFKQKRCEASKENIGSWINGAKEKKKRRRWKRKKRAELEKDKAEKKKEEEKSGWIEKKK